MDEDLQRKSIEKHVSYSTVDIISHTQNGESIDFESSIEFEEEEEHVDEEIQEEIKLRRKIRHDVLDILDDLPDDEFVASIEGIKEERRNLTLENRVFENFLKSNEPALLVGLNQAYQSIKELEQTHPLIPLESYDGTERLSLGDKIGPQFVNTKAYIFSSSGPRINLSQRTDLVLRDVEIMQESLDTFIEKAKKSKFILKAEIEESAKRLEDTKEVIEDFEQSIVIDAIDPITQRIPAEKFIWFMQEWLKARRLTTEKLRLRNNSLKIQYSKLKTLLLQKAELGESVTEVDFEQFRIANKHLLENIEEKNKHLIELKKINGRANLNLSKHKNYLQTLLAKMKNSKNMIEEVSYQKRHHEKAIRIAEKELEEAKMKHQEVLVLVENYKVPEIGDYMKVKSKFKELNKKIKILQRKNNIVKIILASKINTMKRITGEHTVKASWFVQGVTDQDLDDYNYMLVDDEDFIFDPNRKRMEVESEFDIFKVLKNNR